MIVFLHGVPETSALWDKVRAEFDEETVALQLPGFGCARPDGFGATKEEYAAWLVSELEPLAAWRRRLAGGSRTLISPSPRVAVQWRLDAERRCTTAWCCD